jgi:hypothetical protein
VDVPYEVALHPELILHTHECDLPTAVQAVVALAGGLA